MQSIILKSPLTMMKRITKWMLENGSLVTEKTNNACYIISDDGIAITCQYIRDELYSITVDHDSNFVIENDEVVCIDGTPNKLLKAYEYCETRKDRV